MDSFSELPKAALLESEADRGSYQPLPTSKVGIPYSGYKFTLALPQDQGPLWKSLNLLYSRLTYYWISVGSLSLAMLLEIVAFSKFLASEEKDDGILAQLIGMSMLSIYSFVLVAVILRWQYTEPEQANPRVNEVAAAVESAVADTLVVLYSCFPSLIVILLTSIPGIDDSESDDIRGILLPLVAVLTTISMAALVVSARITYCAVDRARRIGLVTCPAPSSPDAAWLLGITSESQSIQPSQTSTIQILEKDCKIDYEVTVESIAFN